MGNDWPLVDRISLAAFVGLIAISVYGYTVLPPDARPIAFIMPSVAALIGGIVTMTVKTPMRLNLPFEVSEEALEEAAPLNVAFQRFLRAELIVGLAALEFIIIESARGIWGAPALALAPLAFVAALVATVTVFMVRVWRIARG